MAEHIIGNVEVLEERVDELEVFTAFAQEVAEQVDLLMHNVHAGWEGVSAAAQKEFFEQWYRDHEQMVTAVFRLRAALAVAAENGRRVQKIHACMWPAMNLE